MSEYGDLIKGKCDAFADRVVKLNDYLLKQESLVEELRSKKEKRKTIPIMPEGQVSGISLSNSFEEER